MTTNPELTTIRPIEASDLPGVAQVHSQAFSRQRASDLWIGAKISSHPVVLGYVATKDELPIGYIFWEQISGIRQRSVIELAQMAVLPDFQGKGVGRRLIIESFSMMQEHLRQHSQELGALIVKTGLDNPARRLYEQTLDVAETAVIEGLFAKPEVIMTRTFS